MLKRLLLAAALTLGPAAAWAQASFPTPGGATVPGFITMCLSGNIAVPCNPGGGAVSSITAPATIATGGNSIPMLTFTPNSGANSSLGTANGGSELIVFVGASQVAGFGSGVTVPVGNSFNWSAGGVVTSSLDPKITAASPGVVTIDNASTTAGAQIRASAFDSGGTVPVSSTSSCTGTLAVAGGATAGTVTATCTTAQAIILTAMPAAPNGYSCFVNDRTTNGVTIQQTATTTTSATFSMRTLPTGSVGSGTNDVFQYSCMGY